MHYEISFYFFSVSDITSSINKKFCNIYQAIAEIGIFCAYFAKSVKMLQM